MKQFILLISFLLVQTVSYGQQVFNINYDYNNKFFFVSLSDILPYIEDEKEEKEYSMIPNNYRYNVPEDQERYVILPHENRNNLLKYLKLSEEDKMYIYDFVNNKMITYKIKDLKGIAVLNVYDRFEDGISRDESTGEDIYDEWTYRAYQLGFQIPLKEKYITENNHYEDFFVSVGPTNPFEQGKMYPILWKEINSATFPLNKLSKNEKDFIKENNKTEITKAYFYTLNNYKYYLLNFNLPTIQENSYERGYMVLVVLKDNKLVSEELILTGGNNGYLPLNMQPRTEFDVCTHLIHQWTGKLFKNSPPVYFGFTYAGDGCPWISKIELVEDNRIFINCDNRH
jgi:hypothetical protein